MENKRSDSVHHFSSLHPLLSIVSLLLLLHPMNAGAQNTNNSSSTNYTVPVNVGVVLDMDKWIGQMGLSCISMAISDFYASHGYYKTRIVLNTRDSKDDVVGAAAAALDLMKNVEVQAIIGPVSSMQAEFIIRLGQKANVPIISFSATNPSLSSIRSPFFIRSTQNDSSQVAAISSIVKSFGWREVVLVYVDNEFGAGILPFLTDALDEVNAHVSYRSSIPPMATDDQIERELNKLMTMQTRVFVVHMLHELGSRLFNKAMELGMMSKGYAWIITDAMANELNLLDSSSIDSMQGVIGVKSHIPQTKELLNFIDRWKLNFQRNNPMVHSIPQLSVYGLWAYDSTTALAMAVEKLVVAASNSTNNINLGYQKLSSTRNVTSDLNTIGVSNNGVILLQEILNTKLQGLTGAFEIVDGQIKSPASYKIVNVIGTKEKIVGFWTVDKEFVTQVISNGTTGKNLTYSTRTGTDLENIIWPGFTTTSPQGWMFPTNGKVLRVLVPFHDDEYNQFVQVTRDYSNNKTMVTGYCIDIFDAVIASLPYAIRYEYIPFTTPDGKRAAGSYNDLVYQVYLQNYDVGVGDISISANRSHYVDFSMPFMESGVIMIVPIKDNKSNAWIFTKPLTWDLWLTIFILFVLIGILIWILEHRVNEEFRGPPSNQVGTIFWFAFSTMVFAQKEKIVSNLARFVLIIWFLVVFIITQAYTASFTSMLTVEQLSPTTTRIDELIKNKEYIGYPIGSFVFQFLLQLGFPQSRLVAYGSPEDLHDLFNNNVNIRGGRITAAFNEIPYVQRFLSTYCSKYTTVSPTYRSDGFGFVFPVGSRLVSDINRALLNVRKSDQMAKIEDAWFPKSSNCSDTNTTSTSSSIPNSLSIKNFWGLFFIIGLTILMAFISHLILFLYKHRNIVTDSLLSFKEKLLELANLFDNRNF